MDDGAAWFDAAQVSFDAASELRVKGYWRPCASRAYYAAFSRVTGALIKKGLTPRMDFGTWSHESLPRMVRDHLLNDSAAANLSSVIERLYSLRLFADYTPRTEYGRKEAFEACGLMYQVFRQVAR